MIEYKDGDLLRSGCDLMCHQVNCQGVMGSGIAKQVRILFPRVYEAYKNFCEIHKSEEVLGTVYLCPLSEDSEQYMANMFAQNYYLPRGVNHTNYDCFTSCCKQIKAFATRRFPSKLVRIGFPDHIGCGLAGGNWDIVREILNTEFKESKWRAEIWKLN